MDTIILEVRAAEGGDHAKRLVIDQFGVYAKTCAASGAPARGAGY